MRIPWSSDVRRLVGSRQPAWSAFLARPALVHLRAAAPLYGAFSLFSFAVAMLSDQPVHRLWGGTAAVAYACAALVSLLSARLPAPWGARHAVTAAMVVAVTGALLVPLCWLAAAGHGMPEVWVVARSARALITHGKPYQSAAVLGSDVYGYNPYLPGMTLFGLPRAIFGGGFGTDPRLWDAFAFLAAFAASLRIACATVTGSGDTARAARGTAMLAGSPLVAFPLAVSGNDLPVIGLICLGLALAGRPRPVLAGLALGAAATLKATAWPALLIVLVLFAVRDGRAAAARFAGGAAFVLALVAGPILLTQPADLVANTIGFPLGLTRAHSPAASPLPGHLIAATGPAGHLAVIMLLAATAAAFGVLLAARPPRTAAAAAGYLALALAALFTLAPATRWGYFIYPACAVSWAWLAGPRRASRGDGTPFHPGTKLDHHCPANVAFECQCAGARTAAPEAPCSPSPSLMTTSPRATRSGRPGANARLPFRGIARASRGQPNDLCSAKVRFSTAIAAWTIRFRHDVAAASR